MAELKPCPFCGCTDIQYLISGHFQPWGDAGIRLWYHCSCYECGAEIDTGSCHTLKEAAREWNRRADARQHALKTGVCPMCEDCPDGCPIEIPKDSRNIVTNADRIRSMSDKELAEFLRNIRDCGDYEELKFIGGVRMDYVSVIDWLKQSAKEE